MTKEEFIVYVKAIIDMEIETAKRTNPIIVKDERYKTVEGLKEFVADSSTQEPSYELVGALKLIEEALNKVGKPTPSPSYPNPTLPYGPFDRPFDPMQPIGVPNTSPDWTYRPEHQPLHVVYCTTNTSQK